MPNETKRTTKRSKWHAPTTRLKGTLAPLLQRRYGRRSKLKEAEVLSLLYEAVTTADQVSRYRGENEERLVSPPDGVRLLGKPKSSGPMATAMAIGAAALFVVTLVLTGPFSASHFLPPRLRLVVLTILFFLAAVQVGYGFLLHRKNSSHSSS